MGNLILKQNLSPTEMQCVERLSAIKSNFLYILGQKSSDPGKRPGSVNGSAGKRTQDFLETQLSAEHAVLIYKTHVKRNQ